MRTESGRRTLSETRTSLDFGFYNMDCMEGMKQFPDKFFDLAIVDPPYGINITGRHKAPVLVGGAEGRSAVCGGYGKGRPPIGGAVTMKAESASSKSNLRFIIPSTIQPHRAKGTLRNLNAYQNTALSGAAISFSIISAHVPA